MPRTASHPGSLVSHREHQGATPARTTMFGTPLPAIVEDVPAVVGLGGPAGAGEDAIVEQVRAGEWYVLHDGQVLVAALRVRWADPGTWGRSDDDDAVYVDTLLVDPAWSGGPIERALLEWAGSLAAFGDRHWLRLECPDTDAERCAFYAELGFVEAARVVSSGSRAVLFERPA